MIPSSSFLLYYSPKMTDETNPSLEADIAFLITTVKAIVTHPNDVVAERSIDDLGVLIKLRVNEEDMSRIVGKEGRTAKALRTLLRLVGSKFDQRVNLKILEPDGSEKRVEQPATSTNPEIKTPPKDKEPAKQQKTETKKSEINENASAAFEDVI